MNLPDLLRRKDRAAKLEAGTAEPCNLLTRWGTQRAVRLSPNASLRLIDAHQYSALRGFPSDLHWQLLEGQGLRVTAMPHAQDISPASVALIARDSAEPVSILLDWPVWTLDAGFDLLIEASGTEDVVIGIGRVLDPRAKMMPLIKGHGVEIGPGLTPRITPRPDLRIEYVEEKTPEQWQEVYGHGKATMDALTPEVLESYRIGSALTLEEWGPESLDFIFSNHVFEHLVNPLQVMRNWLGRLKPDGCILAVIPDARFTFDLRQSYSTMAEMLAEEQAGHYAVEDEKYHKWCRDTAPYNTIDNLKQRNYSIHVHYYTPDLIRDMAQELIGRGCCRSVFIDTVPNNKEFGLIIRK